ncbi:putative U1 small nuclear ribonucleoprotein Usp102p [[Candida] jaroonii]|uniref:U1 small nuclear ribonucleoprotein Usp102p n=1 Tax=[Candida] jaroonii TaxID=467808 RepID=A0ACA9Y6U0_9ASCO|nr:putative U1 small nuclear ribonucleoprotein Usp102p [[Candida] jaroonii]
MSTIYINNLNEKVSHNTLRNELLQVFQEYNPKTVHVKKTLALKGQAFISFNNDVSKIVKKYQNFKVFGKPMKISVARSKSYDIMDEKKVEELKEIRRYKKAGKPNNTLVLEFIDSKSIKQEVEEAEETKETKESKETKETKETKEITFTTDSENIEDHLKQVFDFEGFLNLRLIKARNIAFIEFENVEQSKKCFQNIPIDKLKQLGKLSYAK